MTEGSVETLNSEKGDSFNDSEKLSIRNQEASFKTVNWIIITSIKIIFYNYFL